MARSKKAYPNPKYYKNPHVDQMLAALLRAVKIRNERVRPPQKATDGNDSDETTLEDDDRFMAVEDYDLDGLKQQLAANKQIDKPYTGLDYGASFDDLTDELKVKRIEEVHAKDVMKRCMERAKIEALHELKNRERIAFQAAKKAYKDQQEAARKELAEEPSGSTKVKYLNSKVPKIYAPSPSINTQTLYSDILHWVMIPKRDEDYYDMFPCPRLDKQSRANVKDDFEGFAQPLMALQAEQLFSNHLLHRHPGTFYTNSSPWKEIGLIKKYNTFTINLMATLCYMYGNGSWDYSVPKTCATIKEMENTNKASFKQAMELVNHFVSRYHDLDSDNVYSLRVTANEVVDAVTGNSPRCIQHHRVQR